MSQWYLSKNGQALGPFDTEKVISLIQFKEINHLDLVYRSGDTQWQPLAQIAEFAEYLNKEKDPVVPPAKAQPSADAIWVLLKKVKTEKGKEYKQIGPFTEDQVVELVDRGEVKFTDFAWKKGLETWVKISELEEFEQPLPSSPNIDMSLYEKTTPDFRVDSDSDSDAAKATMTQMVKIERFEHKSMTKSMLKPKPNLEDVEEPVDSDATRIVPFNAQEARGQVKAAAKPSAEDSEINLWSLEPPANAKEKTGSFKALPKNERKDKSKSKVDETDFEHTHTQTSTHVRSHGSKSRKKKSSGVGNFFQKDNLVWIAAAGLLVFSTLLIYLSFSQDSAEIIYEESEQSANPSSVEAPAKKPASVETPPPKPEPREAKKEVAPEPETDRVDVPPQDDSVDEEEQTQIVEAVQPAEEAVDTRTPASSKAAPLSKSKKIPEPVKEKPKAKKEIKAAVAPKPVPKKEKVEVVAKGSPAKGSAKTVAFYKQRDRKALFYSSLKAETLAVEIEGEFKKLKDNKSAWNRFYGQWRKKVSAALASDIREFPARSELYGYPQIMASFKKDYNLFYKYGESFNAKVTGGRAPSDAPADMKSLFAKYKSQAQNLGN